MRNFVATAVGLGLMLILAACGDQQETVDIGLGAAEATSADATVAGSAPATESVATFETAATRTSVVPSPTETDLVPCSNFAEIQSSVLGQLGDRTNPDDRLMGVIRTYALGQPETFAGIWIDRNNAGVVVVAFTDDPEPHRAELNSRGPMESDNVGVEPPPPITDARPLGERDDFAFDVVQVRFTETELFDAQEELHRLFGLEGSGLQSSGIDTVRNRVSIDLVDPTPAGIEAVEEAIEGLPVCGTITYSSEPPSGELRIIPDPGQPLVFPPGLAPVRWELDPAFATPQASDTTIQVLATEIDCASGRDMGDALRGPEVLETESEVVIAFAVVPVVGGADCQGNPSTPVAVTLDAPLADRILRDVLDLNDAESDLPGIVLAPVDQPAQGEGWTVISSAGAIEAWSPPQWAGALDDYWEIVDTYWEQDLSADDIDFESQVVLAWTVPVAADSCGARVLNDIAVVADQLSPMFDSAPTDVGECNGLHQVVVVALERETLPETVIFTDPVRNDVSIEIVR